MKNQRGSVTVLAILTMTFIGIIIAGLLPMSSNELKIGTMNKDVIEAQYAAEAGAKRAIVGFSQPILDLSWIDEGDIPFIDDVNKKKYNVIIYLAADSNKTPLFSSALTSGETYIIKSTGTVGKTTKTVFVTINLLSSESVFSKYTVYSKRNLTISNSPTILGDIGSGGDITVSNNPTITGRAYTPNIPEFDKWNPCLVSGGYFLPTSEDILLVNIPALDTVPYVDTGTPLSNKWDSAINDASGNYYSNGDLSLGKTNITGINGQSVNIYINGSLDANNGTIISGDNIIIYAKGDINLHNTTIIGNHIIIYATGKIDMNNTSSIEQASSNGTVKINTEGTFQLTNTATINSEFVTINAKKSIDFNNAISINKGSLTAITKIYSGDDIAFSNNINLGGSAGLVESDGAIVLSNTVNLLTTVFVSESGASTISNGVDLAGFYTNGSLTVSNSPNITYNGKKTQILDTLDLGGVGVLGGASLINISNWKSI